MFLESAAVMRGSRLSLSWGVGLPMIGDTGLGVIAIAAYQFNGAAVYMINTYACNFGQS